MAMESDKTKRVLSLATDQEKSIDLKMKCRRNALPKENAFAAPCELPAKDTPGYRTSEKYAYVTKRYHIRHTLFKYKFKH